MLPYAGHIYSSMEVYSMVTKNYSNKYVHIPQRHFFVKSCPDSNTFPNFCFFSKPLLTDLKKAHKFSSILLSQLHSNEAQLHATLLVFITSCAAVSVPFFLFLYERQAKAYNITL